MSSTAKELAAALDPSRSYWQRWTSPLMLSEIDRCTDRVAKKGKSLCTMAILEELYLPDGATDADIMTTGIIMHARCRAQRAGRPLYVLDEACARALAETDLPAETVGSIRLPHDGFYIAVPPSVVVISDPMTGDHVLEGIHVCRDRAFVETVGDVDDVVSIVMVGKAKGSRKIACLPGFTEPEDSLRYVAFDAARRLDTLPKLAVDRIGIQIVVNLIWALEGRYLVEEKVIPRRPTSPGKAKVLARRGFGLHPYTILHLGRKATDARDKPEPTGRHVSAHIVRGHWVSYWTLDAADAPTYGEKVRPDGKKLLRIRHWLPPAIRGVGEVKPQIYKVKA